MKIKLRLVILIVFISINCYGQKSKDSLLTIWNNTKLVDTVRANAYKYFIDDYYLGSKTDSAYAMTLDLIDFTKDHNLKKQKADALILLSDVVTVFGNNAEATKSLNESLSLYTELNNKRGMAMAIRGLGISYRKIFNLDEAKKYFEKSLQISRELKDTLLMSKALLSIGNIYDWRYKSDTALEYFRQSRELANLTNNKYEEAVAIINMASSYNQKKEFELAKKEIDNAIQIGTDINDFNILSNAYSNLSHIYFKKKQYDSLITTANKMLHYAENISLKSGIDGAYYYFFEAYKGKKDFDLTMKYHELRRQYRTTVDDHANIKTLEKMKIDNHRTQDSLVNVATELKTEMAYQNERTNLTLAWGGSLSAMSIFAFLIFKNTKRKQRKAEKEHQDQIDEKEKILKDLELTTIDAMIAGQEKERERLASDLHDSVGATLAAAKLQFEYLINNQIDIKTSEAFIKKTSTLLEDAYVEIRSMAHLKNSGVMAKNGLLPAIEKLSLNASGINGLTFEVQSFGLDQRLENTLEISVFRIIQELITNIIKHANATKGMIHLTNHEDNLNIMVEDNGKGFNPHQITKSNAGMGINSIDKRVEHLDGKLTIESEINQGTTIIIDLPI
ncbi:MAG: sensor histidine kinase [Psychroserpens sp.]|uniref:tetratricopeptide repeat-containing sensor histidine kinase n=1 Tax=Psychroserpens sp. TaxID=2020870 RepID=UPI003002E583